MKLNMMELVNFVLNHFKVSKIITAGYDFAWDISKNGKVIGELFYSNDDKEWWFVKDNFSHQRKSYRINFPIKEEVFFVELFKTIGIELI